MSLFFYETVTAFIGGIFASPTIVKEAIRRNRKIVMTNSKFLNPFLQILAMFPVHFSVLEKCEQKPEALMNEGGDKVGKAALQNPERSTNRGFDLSMSPLMLAKSFT